MERERVINYQKRFSDLHLIVMLLGVLIVIEYEIYSADNNIMQMIVGSIVICVLESIFRFYSFFNSMKVVIGYRFLEIVCVSYMISCKDFYYLHGILYEVFIILAIEFVINFDLADRYYVYFALFLSVVPAIAFQIIRVMKGNSEYDVLNSVITIIIAFVILIFALRIFYDITDRLENKYLQQLRFNDAATAANQELVENQEKVKKANEQLAMQAVKLEIAYRKINNVNMEISLQNEILQLVSARLEVEELMERIAATVRTKMNVGIFAILLLPNAVVSKNLLYEIKTIYGEKYQQYIGERIVAGDFLQYIERKETIVDNHVVGTQYPFVKNTEIGSMLIIPLLKNSEVLGGLYIADSKYDAFLDNVPFFESAVSSINLAIENGNLYTKLEEMAVTDGLTQIYNRRYLNQACEQYIVEALRDKTPFSVALFDIDKFKNVNDSYGHLFGDEALKKISEKAKELADKVGGIVGRYGGEEFMVLFPKRGLQDTYDAVKEFQDQVRNMVFYHNNEVVKIRVSVGISSYPETCLHPNELMNNSDLAMYYSKQNGRDRITIDSSNIRELVRMR